MGVQKPPVDIEWYDDGFSIEEQKKLACEYHKAKRASRVKLSVPEKYHKKMKDKIISELRQKLAANEEYIKELEEANGDINKHPIVVELARQLQSEKAKRENLQQQYTTINNKYAEILNDPDSKYQEYKDTIKDLEDQVQSLKRTRDELIGKLCSQSKN